MVRPETAVPVGCPMPFSTLVYAVHLFVGMLLFAEAGRRLARARSRRGAADGLGVVDTAVLGLLGLIVAFSFSGASSRFDARRQLIVEETNAIGTAWLRLDLLPAQTQPMLRSLFRDYLDSRIELYRLFPDREAVLATFVEGERIQGEIWKQALAAGEGSQSATMLLVPALNQMFDIATTRTASAVIHPPPVIFVVLFCLALGGGLIAGYSTGKSARRDWLRTVAFAAITAATFYVILALEYPRSGAIQIEEMDRILTRLRASMG